MKFLEVLWSIERRVTRTIIFRKALEIDPTFCAGVGKEGYLRRMKKWFYYHFTKHNYLSICKLASVGQKLPPNWEYKMDEMRDRVRRRQKPEAHGDETICIAGVKDAHFVNTDHIPDWCESVGNYSWGKKDSG